MNRPIAEPAEQDEKKIYRRHAEKIEFVNPKGAEYYAACHPHAVHRHKNYDEKGQMYSFGPLSRSGRPVK